MKAQQAPTAVRSGVSMQTSRLAPDHTASISTKRMKGGISQASMSAMTMVSAMLTGPVNRCSRIHARGPTTVDGGGDGASVEPLTKAGPAALPAGAPDGAGKAVASV